MTINQIVDAVRACAQGHKTKVDISNILHSHGCYALLNRNENSIGLIERTVNHVAIKERYRVCDHFFKNITFPYVVIKGAVLSRSIYKDPFLRVSGDIDVLIHRRNADDAKHILQECGFIQGRVTENALVPFTRKEILYQSAMSHQTAPFIKSTSNKLCPYVNLDINMDILWGESDWRVDVDKVLLHREKVSLFNVDFYKLMPEMEFVALCLHHYKDMNSIYLLSKGSLRLGLFCDIYFYLRNAHPSATRISELARQFNVGQYLYVCLVHTMEIFDDPVLLPYIEMLMNQRDIRLLDSFGLNDKERKYWDIPFLQRLFHPNLSKYMERFLTVSDIEKIRINQENM